MTTSVTAEALESAGRVVSEADPGSTFAGWLLPYVKGEALQVRVFDVCEKDDSVSQCVASRFFVLLSQDEGHLGDQLGRRRTFDIEERAIFSAAH